ncbi:hypothetical protein SAMN05444008_12718 [Cnuella takakiae]|uniref:Transglutaminase-like superfamily protein n=1 Tax=Cnuella takakiae TaxID=1302690 RepID=A0A1M5J3G0_9BACT|nr:hypothetical protein [Cnuella takakiae]OLY91334.1 hypothetical protein BUE76_05035 [Cnuella takakiae]SHG34533.1 hypothetical protein SAMN05444008_12718 [Cnuella takakiae]
MNIKVLILLVLLGVGKSSWSQEAMVPLYCYDDTVLVPQPFAPAPLTDCSASSVQQFVAQLPAEKMAPYVAALMRYRQRHPIDDWLYYQLVRKVAQQLSPKADNYYRYTLYKWWLLAQSGYDTRLTWSGRYLLFYVQSDETIYNIPFRMQDGKQYVCLNYHDYGNIDFNQNKFEAIQLPLTTTAKAFSYQVHQLPNFRDADYTVKQVAYEAGNSQYHFRIKLNTQMKQLFSNYPVVDYNVQFNMPISRPTYESLIPELRKQVRKLKQKEGIDFLLHFTRYAFLYKPDGEAFGSEKRLSPEQTLLSEYSDCEDRAALFFFLVKELYNLPMIVLAYPSHVTLAVQLEKPSGTTIEYGGKRYTVCEPSPQRYDLGVGQLPQEYKHQSYEIAYAYTPK